MSQELYYKAGRITRTHGVKGEVSASLLQPALFAAYPFEMFFLKQGNGYIPFFLKSFSFNPGKNVLLLAFEDVSDPQAASPFLNQDIFLLTENLPSPDKKQFFPEEIIGYLLIDTEKGELGPITEVMELPMQQVFRVEKEGREILIPAAEDLIRNIDRIARKIFIQAPYGLIDIYLRDTPESDEDREDQANPF